MLVRGGACQYPFMGLGPRRRSVIGHSSFVVGRVALPVISRIGQLSVRRTNMEHYATNRVTFFASNVPFQFGFAFGANIWPNFTNLGEISPNFGEVRMDGWGLGMPVSSFFLVAAGFFNFL